MHLAPQTGMRLRVFRDLLGMAGTTRRWWLVPTLIVLVLLGLALAGLQAIEVLSPFVYAVL